MRDRILRANSRCNDSLSSENLCSQSEDVGGGRSELVQAVVIKNWQTFRLWTQQCDAQTNYEVWTPAPAVFEALSPNVPVRDISDLVTHRQADEIGEISLQLSKAWGRTINEVCGNQHPNLKIGNLLARSLPHLVTSLFYHQFELIELSKLYPSVSIPENRSDPDDGEISSLASLGMDYYALLAKQDCNTAFLKLEPHDGDDLEEADLYPGKELKREGVLSRTVQLVLKISSSTPNIIGRAILHRINKSSGKQVSPWKNPCGKAMLFKRNTLLTSVLPILVLRRVNICQISIPKFDRTKWELSTEDKFDDLYGLLINDARRITEERPWLKAAVGAAATRVSSYLSSYFLPRIAQLNETEAQWLPARGRSERVFLLSNSVYDPVENAAAAIANHKRGADVVCFQHGGSGLLRQYRTMQPFSDMTRSDGYCCYNSHEVTYYRKITGRRDPPFFCYGAWNEVSALLPKLSRFIVRKRWSIKSRDTLILYAPTRFKEGHLWLPDGFRDMPYWKVVKQVVCAGLGRVDARCVVKVHQKGVSARDMPLLYQRRKSPYDELTLPENVSVQTYPDLTYSRHAADIIIVDRATSTLGWAMSSQAIVIYLDLPFDRLEEDIKAKFSEAAFVVDMETENGVAELKNLLGLPLAELRAKWVGKENQRRLFLEQYVLGPKRPRRDFAQWLLSDKLADDFG